MAGFDWRQGLAATLGQVEQNYQTGLKLQQQMSLSELALQRKAFYDKQLIEWQQQFSVEHADETGTAEGRRQAATAAAIRQAALDPEAQSEALQLSINERVRGLDTEFAVSPLLARNEQQADRLKDEYELDPAVRQRKLAVAVAKQTDILEGELQTLPATVRNQLEKVAADNLVMQQKFFGTFKFAKDNVTDTTSRGIFDSIFGVNTSDAIYRSRNQNVSAAAIDATAATVVQQSGWVLNQLIGDLKWNGAGEYPNGSQKIDKSGKTWEARLAEQALSYQSAVASQDAKSITDNRKSLLTTLEAFAKLGDGSALPQAAAVIDLIDATAAENAQFIQGVAVGNPLVLPSRGQALRTAKDYLGLPAAQRQSGAAWMNFEAQSRAATEAIQASISGTAPQQEQLQQTASTPQGIMSPDSQSFQQPAPQGAPVSAPPLLQQQQQQQQTGVPVPQTAAPVPQTPEAVPDQGLLAAPEVITPPVGTTTVQTPASQLLFEKVDGDTPEEVAVNQAVSDLATAYESGVNNNLTPEQLNDMVQNYIGMLVNSGRLPKGMERQLTGEIVQKLQSVLASKMARRQRG